MTDLRQRLGELDQLDAPDMRASIDQRAAELDQAPPQSLVRTSASGWRGPLIAVGTAFVILFVVAGSLLLIGRDDSSVVKEPTTTVVSTTLPPTTEPPATVPSTTVPAEAVVPFPPPELPVLEVPLSEAVPGFSDTIVWSAWSIPGSGVMRWRSSEPMAELLLLSEDNFSSGVGLDASANWVAQDFDVHMLAVQAVPTVQGEPSRREIVGQDAQGGVEWHDTEPGHLAWLECANPLDGPTTLVTLDASDPSADPIRVRSFDQGCRLGSWGLDEPSVTLVRWGRTGVWVAKYPGDWEAKWHEDTEGQDAEGQDVIESVLIDADGAEIATVSDARMIGMSPDGTSVWQSDDSEGPYFVLSPNGQQRSTVPGLDDGARLHGAWWSADGTRLAMWLYTDGDGRILRTVDSVSGEVITDIAEPGLDGWGPGLAWSTDSRFLVYEEVPRGTDSAVLVIHDTATNTTTKFPLPQNVHDIRVR